MTDKVQKIRAEVKRRRESHRKAKRIESAFEDNAILSFIDSMQEESKIDWMQELQEKLDSLSKEDFEKVMAKYSRYGEEEPVSEDLEEASKEWLEPQLDKSYASYGEGKMMELTHFDGYAMLDAIEFGAKWKREQMVKNAIEGEWWRCAVVLPAKYMNTDDIRSVKIIIIENN